MFKFGVCVCVWHVESLVNSFPWHFHIGNVTFINQYKDNAGATTAALYQYWLKSQSEIKR